MQIVPPTAMERITPHANTGSTDFPLTHAAKILVLWIGQEDFTSSVHLLRMALQLTTQIGKRCQVSVVGYCYQQVNICMGYPPRDREDVRTSYPLTKGEERGYTS